MLKTCLSKIRSIEINKKMLSYIKQTLKIDFTHCRLLKDGYVKYYEFSLLDGTKLRTSEKDILYKLNDRHSKIQFDKVALGKYLLQS